MNTITRIQQGFDQKVERIIDALQRMSARERYMVIFASILVVVTLVGFSLWKNAQSGRSATKASQ